MGFHIDNIPKEDLLLEFFHLGFVRFDVDFKGVSYIFRTLTQEQAHYQSTLLRALPIQSVYRSVLALALDTDMLRWVLRTFDIDSYKNNFNELTDHFLDYDIASVKILANAVI